MMGISYKVSSIDELEEEIEGYIDSLTNIVDDFWESHIINSDFFAIIYDEETIGCFSIYNNNRITMFSIKERYIKHAQDFFKRILSELEIKKAYVTTCDELFLSLCLDFHVAIELQAYFFNFITDDCIEPPKYSRDCIVEIDSNELDKVNRNTDDFFDFINKSDLINNTCKIYKLIDHNIELGYGVLFSNKLIKEYWACGMVTIEEHRRKGVGRSIQIHLADICRELGGKPVAGCWYGNVGSKSTIESAGRYTKTRLLNVSF